MIEDKRGGVEVGGWRLEVMQWKHPFTEWSFEKKEN